MYTNQLLLDRLTARLSSVLSEGQKVRLLTDIHSLSDPAMNALGVPRVRLARVEGGRWPSPAALARSWDDTLTARVVGAMLADAGEAGAVCVMLPGARAVAGGAAADAAALTEDPHLAGVMAGAFIRGAEGKLVLTEGYESPAMSTEKAPEDESMAAVLRDVFVHRPWQAALSAGEAAVVIDGPDGEEVARLGEHVPMIRRHADAGETVRALVRGELCLKGSESALQAALHQYRRLHAAMEHGKVTAGELETAVLAGEALSEEALDAALRRLLAFALSCAPESAAAVGADVATAEVNESPSDERQAGAAQAEAASSRLSEQEVIRAMAGATVLLDNRRGILPLETRTRKGPLKVALIGALREDESREVIRRLTEAGCLVMGWQPGMTTEVDARCDELLEKAVALAGSEPDVVLLFPDTGEDSRTRAEAARGGLPRLSAAARALCDRVCAVGKPVVLVLGERAVEPTFLERQTVMPAAVLMAPLRAEGGMAHLVETLLGHRAPAGHLTATIPTGEADEARRGMPVGPFVGYRYYDTVGFGTAYPFGHGLTYTKFRYSHMVVESGRVRFTVHNDGRRPGVAVPQVYVGLQIPEGETTAPDDIRAMPQDIWRWLKRTPRPKALPPKMPLCPKRELAAFTCVELAPGQTRTITLEWAPMTVLGGRKGSPATSRTYTISVGESVADIRLTGTVRLPGVALPAGGEAVNYLPTISNIASERYTLEAWSKPMKSSLRNLLFGIAALVMAVSLKIYNIVSVSDAVFLDILAIALAAGAAVFFAFEWIERRRELARRRSELDAQWNAAYPDADAIPVPTAGELFDKEYGGEDEDAEGADASDKTAVEAYDYYADVDKTLTLSLAERELCALAAERGVALDGATARSVLASFMTSRIIVVQDMTDEAFKSLLGVLCEYFGCPVSIDRVDASYTSEAAVLHVVEDARSDADASTTDGPVKRKLAGAMDAATQDPRHMYVAALSHVRWDTLSAYFVPFARYARMPRGQVSYTFSVNAETTQECVIPENMWFVLRPAEGELLGRIPDYIAEVATVHRWSLGVAAVDRAAERLEYHPFTYGQMLYLSERVRTDFALDEDIWKQFDRLEAYVARHSEFRMGNKLWLGLECYIAALLDMGCDRSVALDEAMAVGLLPAIIPALSGRLTREDRGLGETLDALFGDGQTPLCRRTVKQSGAELV